MTSNRDASRQRIPVRASGSPAGVGRWGRIIPFVAVMLLLLLTITPNILAGGVGTSGTSNGPLIVDFAAIDNGNRVWTFEGQVTDTNPGSCIVYLGGLPSLQGQMVDCDVSGYFSIDIPLTADDDGTATAQAVDGQGLKSNVVYTDVSDPS